MRSSKRGHELGFVGAIEIIKNFRHSLMRVAAIGARQIAHELVAQSPFDIVENVFLHRLHTQHACDNFHRKAFRQLRQHARGVVGLDLGDHDRDRLRIFVLQIGGENGFIDVGQLVPHRACRRGREYLP